PVIRAVERSRGLVDFYKRQPVMRIPDGEHPAVEAVLRSGGLTLVTPVAPGARLVVPPDTTLLLQAEDYEVTLTDGKFDFSPLFRHYELVFPAELRRMTEGARLYVISGGKPYRCADDGCHVKLPVSSCGEFALRCVTAGREYILPLSQNDDGSLSVEGSVAKNCSAETLQVIAGEDILTLAPDEILSLPNTVDVMAADDKTVVVPSFVDPALNVYAVDTRSETVEGETSSGYPMPDCAGNERKDEPLPHGNVVKSIAGIVAAVIIILLVILFIM
ncbi:MAG: hypothetical protein K2H98_08045, partial [Duncaniella sp.]|nr:hypothetical protein [Duncaniella sp.]